MVIYIGRQMAVGGFDPPLLFIYASSNKKSVHLKVEKYNFVSINDNLFEIFMLNNANNNNKIR